MCEYLPEKIIMDKNTEELQIVNLECALDELNKKEARRQTVEEWMTYYGLWRENKSWSKPINVLEWLAYFLCNIVI